MEWISVEDSPPPKSEKEQRLVWGPGIGFLVATFVGRGCAGYLKYYTDEVLYRWYPDGIPGITHWMPLPEPPEKETITIIVNLSTGEQKTMTVDELTECMKDAIRQAYRNP
jgi:hypothetical protein